MLCLPGTPVLRLTLLGPSFSLHVLYGSSPFRYKRLRQTPEGTMYEVTSRRRIESEGPSTPQQTRKGDGEERIRTTKVNKTKQNHNNNNKQKILLRK